MDSDDIINTDDRNSYRVDAHMIVQLYTPPSDKQILTKIEVLEQMCDKQDQRKVPIMLEYQKVSDAVTQLLSVIYRTTPQIAEQLHFINQKVDLIAASIFVNDNEEQIKANLSATGVSILLDEEMEANTTVYIRMTLLPRYYTVITRARVANCRHKPKLDPDKPYLIGFEFMDLPTPDERFLSKYVMKLQLEDRQRSRY